MLVLEQRLREDLVADQLLLEQLLLPLVVAFGLGELTLDLGQLAALLVVLEPQQDLVSSDGVPFLYEQLAHQALGL